MESDGKVTYLAFPGGMDNTSDEKTLPDTVASRLLNVSLDQGGKITLTGTDKPVVPASVAPGPLGIGYYDNGTIKRLIVVTGNIGANSVVAFDEATTTATSIGDSSVTTLANLPKFLQFGSTIYITGYYTSGPSIGSLAKWSGAGNIVPAGLAPASEETWNPINKLSGGALTNTGLSPYQWLTTYEVDGLESNPSDLSQSAFGADYSNNRAEFVSQGAFFLQVQALVNVGKTVFINLYRIGGNLAEARRTKRFQADTSSGSEIRDASTGQRPVDNLPDEDAESITVSTSNDPPPKNATDILQVGNRLFLAVGSRVYFSREDNPEYFGQDSNGVDDDGGYITPDRNDADPIQQMLPWGGITVIGKSKTKDSLYGKAFSEFRFDPVSTKGLPNRFSMAKCDNTLRHVGHDRKVYAVGNDESIELWRPIWNSIRGLAKSDFESVRTIYANNLWFVTFKNGSGNIALGYDDTNECWLEYTANQKRSNGLLVRPNPTTAEDEILLGRTTGDGGGVWSLFTDTNTERGFVITSGKHVFTPGEDICYLKSIEIMATFTGTAGVRLQVEVGPGLDQLYTQTVPGPSSSTGTLVKILALPARMIGKYVKWQIDGTCSDFQFIAATLTWDYMRDAVK